MDCVTLTFTPEALHQIVELTVKKGTGARGLRSVLEQAMMDVFYDAPSHEELKEIVVTEEMIEKGVANVDDGDEFLRKSA